MAPWRISAPRRAPAADTFAAADPVVQAGARLRALAGGAASVFRPPPKFPVIYGSWFGDKMSADMRSCISAGLRSGLTAMEVRTQALPNLDEAKFGTPTNERFQIECARSLGLSSGPTKCRPVWKLRLLGGVEALRHRRDVVSVTASDSHRPQQKGKVDAGGLQKSVKRFDSNYMLVKRDPIAYANVWWAQRIAPALGSRRKIWVLLAEGRVDTSACSKLPRNFVVKPLESKDVQVTSRDAVIVVAPGVTQSWKIGYDLARNAGAPVVFLNSQLSERYSLGGTARRRRGGLLPQAHQQGLRLSGLPRRLAVHPGQTGWNSRKRNRRASGERPTLGELVGGQLTRSVCRTILPFGRRGDERQRHERPALWW